MPRRSARAHLLGLIAVAVLPVWLFAAYLLVEYALHEQSRFEQDALQTARQVSLVVEAELLNLQTILDVLSKSESLAKGDLKAFEDEARRLAQGTDKIIALRDLDGRQLANTQIAQGEPLPPVDPVTTDEREKLKSGGVSVSNVFAAKGSTDYRAAVETRVRTER
jgi:hypothetical protein